MGGGVCEPPRDILIDLTLLWVVIVLGTRRGGGGEIEVRKAGLD